MDFTVSARLPKPLSRRVCASDDERLNTGHPSSLRAPRSWSPFEALVANN